MEKKLKYVIAGICVLVVVVICGAAFLLKKGTDNDNNDKAAETSETTPVAEKTDILQMMSEKYPEEYKFIKDIMEIKVDETTLASLTELCGNEYEEMTSEEASGICKDYIWKMEEGDYYIDLGMRENEWSFINVVIDNIETDEIKSEYTMEDYYYQVKKDMTLPQVQDILGEGKLSYVILEKQRNQADYSIVYGYYFQHVNDNGGVMVIFNNDSVVTEVKRQGSFDGQ